MSTPAFTIITFAYGAAGSDVNDDHSGNITVPPGTTFTDPVGGFFTSADCVQYPDIGVAGAGPSGGSFSSGITYISANSVTLSNPASTSVTNAEWAWGNANGGTIGLNGTTTIIYTDPNPIQAGDALFVVASPDATLTASISDSQNNIWNTALSNPGADVYWQQGFYFIATESITTLTITITTSATYVGTAIGTDFSYFHWRPPVGYVASWGGANQASGNGLSPATGNLVTSVPIAALMSMAAVGSHTIAGTPGWTYVNTSTANGLEYNTVSAPGTYSGTFTQGNSDIYIAIVAAFVAIPIPLFLRAGPRPRGAF